MTKRELTESLIASGSLVDAIRLSTNIIDLLYDSSLDVKVHLWALLDATGYLSKEHGGVLDEDQMDGHR